MCTRTCGGEGSMGGVRWAQSGVQLCLCTSRKARGSWGAGEARLHSVLPGWAALGSDGSHAGKSLQLAGGGVAWAESLPLTPLSLSPSFLIFLLPCSLLIFSFSSHSLPYSPLFSPSHHPAHPSSSSLLCFSLPLVPSVALLSPPTCLLSI